MRTSILLLSLLVVSCSTKPASLVSDQQGVADPCAQYLTAIERGASEASRYMRLAANTPMDTIDFWHLYLDGVEQAGVVTLDSGSLDDCLMAGYFNDSGGFAESLEISAGGRRLLSIAAIPSRRFGTAIYPIPVAEIFNHLTDADGRTVTLALMFNGRENVQGGGTIVVERI